MPLISVSKHSVVFPYDSQIRSVLATGYIFLLSGARILYNYVNKKQRAGHSPHSVERNSADHRIAEYIEAIMVTLIIQK
jgi:hypothetical protein